MCGLCLVYVQLRNSSSLVIGIVRFVHCASPLAVPTAETVSLQSTSPEQFNIIGGTINEYSTITDEAIGRQFNTIGHIRWSMNKFWTY